MTKIVFQSLFFCMFINTLAQAYVGPGIATGFILTVLSILLAVVIAIFGLIWLPIRKLFKKNKSKKKDLNQ